MAEYYLISQLPSLDGITEGAPLPITEEAFSELCGRFLGKRALSAVKSMTLSPERDTLPSGFPLIDAWNESERNLRLALGRIRAEKLQKCFDVGSDPLPPECVKAAEAAFDEENPMEAELKLTDYRLSALEELRPADSFSDDYIFYYGLKLKLLLRTRQFEKAAGEEAYRKIYNSILNGDRLEVKQ